MEKMKILNVGCGSDTYGTDFVDFYPKRKEVLKLDLDNDKLPYNSNYFDEVIAINVLEHLTNFGHFLKELQRVLKPGGKLHLSTDNASYWFWHIKFLSGHYYRVDYAGKEDRHFCLFTTKHLENLMAKFGFRVAKMELFSTWEDSKTKKYGRYPPLNNETLSINYILSKINSIWAFPRIYVEAVKR